MRGRPAASLLRTYWITFDSAALQRQCGVTGYDLEDALRLVRQHVFHGAPLPSICEVVEDVDVSTLDANHVLPNIGVPVWRGVWYPRLNV